MMLPRFLSQAAVRGPEARRAFQDRPRPPRGRRPRSFRGRLEHLEGAGTLLSFGTGGIVTGPAGQAFSLVIQPADQKIVVGGDVGTGVGGTSDFSLVRYNTGGTLDSTFGSGGVVTTSFGSVNTATVNSLLVQPSNGDIVAGGTDIWLVKKTLEYTGDFALARYTANGSLDTTFGSGGTVTTSFPAADGEAGINTVLLRSNGEILAVGSVSPSTTDNFASVALALYTSTGALDKSFGSSGTVVDDSLTTSTSSPNSAGGTTTVYKYFQAGGGALESDNSILVAGSYVTRTEVTTSSGSVSWTTNEQDLALVHYLANGTRDMTFGTNGIAIMPITPTGVATSNAWGTNVLVQPNGSIVEVGTAVVGSNNADVEILLARYNSNGSPDTTFGGVGYVLNDLGIPSRGYTAALEPNGQIVATGTVVSPINQNATEYATERVNADGSFDTTFGEGGTVVTQVLYCDYPGAVGLETTNGQTMIVDAGTAMTSDGGNEDFAMVGYNPAGLDATTTTASSTPNPAVFSQSVTLSATVTADAPGAATPAGSVDFFDTTTDTDLGSATLSGGIASLSITTTWPAGTQSIIASYGGDGNSLQSTASLPITVVVETPSSVALSASPNPSKYGQAVTFTADVTASSEPTVPTGSVDFFDTTTDTDLGSVTLSDGIATLITSALPVGTQTITATYSGDGTYLPSTSSLSFKVKSSSASSAVSTSDTSISTQLIGTISTSSLVDRSPRSVSIDPVEPTPAASSITPSPGLIAQALESSDFLDTLLPGRRRR